MQTRRTFLCHLATATAGLGLLSTTALAAAAPAPIDPADPTAQALGYVADTTKVDAKKYPQHTAVQKCADCALYQGKPGDATGPCLAFAGKLVSAGGWCMAYAKKP
jgi:hypothetical protein